jgi:uncharacterized protein (DUF433 family)
MTIDGRRGREIAPGIVVDPSVRFGRPVIKGTRVPVEIVLGQLAAGLTVEVVAEEYGLTRDAVLGALRYAAERIASEEVRAAG